jgi:hypothetical protein
MHITVFAVERALEPGADISSFSMPNWTTTWVQLMINPNKCQVNYPIIAKIVEMKFEGEKETRKCVIRSWKECDQAAVEHTDHLIDPTKETTKYILHRCAVHVEEAKQLHEALEKTKQQEKK